MSKSCTVGKIINILEQWAPKKLAYDWDNVGLQIGDLSAEVNCILTTLDVNEAVVDEAIEVGAQLIIAHHPLLFKPLKQINFAEPIGRVIRKLICSNIAVYAAHTNLDIASGGVNDWLATCLKLEEVKVMLPEYEEKLYKLHVYVPNSHVDEVDLALTHFGVGQLGDYSECSFRIQGTGTFKPEQGSDPFIGQKGEKEYVEETKLEYILPEPLIKPVITKLINVHPYEEPAYDLIELANQGRVQGLGRIGKLKHPIRLGQFAEQIKNTFQLQGLRITGDPEQMVAKVAVLGGSGEKYFRQAKRLGADVYVTGDLTFHQAQDAEALGLALIDPGHYIEKVMITGLQNDLKVKLADQTLDIEIVTTEVNTDPFIYM